MFAILVAPSSSGQFQPFSPSRQVQFPVWSSDGKELYFHAAATGPEPFRIFRKELGSSEPDVVVDSLANSIGPRDISAPAGVLVMVGYASPGRRGLFWRELQGVSSWHQFPTEVTAHEAIEVRDHLMTSREYYEMTFKVDRSQVWALVQILALTAVMGKWNEKDDRSLARWELAQRFSEEELELGNPERLSWANANLMELFVLKPLIPGLQADAEESATRAEHYAVAFRSVTKADSVNLHSTKRQILRYVGFFLELNENMAPSAKAAERVLKILPESPKFR